MTCIIAAKNNGRILVGADSQVTIGDRCEELSDDKIFFKDQFIVGSTGSLRCQQLLKYTWEVPQDLKITSIVNSIKDCLSENNYSSNESNVEEFDDDILLCFKERILVVGADFALLEVKSDFVCIGSGEKYAYGAMKSLWGSTLGVEDIVRRALQISASYDPFCNDKICFLETSN